MSSFKIENASTIRYQLVISESINNNLWVNQLNKRYFGRPFLRKQNINFTFKMNNTYSLSKHKKYFEHLFKKLSYFCQKYKSLLN